MDFTEPHEVASRSPRTRGIVQIFSALAAISVMGLMVYDRARISLEEADRARKLAAEREEDFRRREKVLMELVNRDKEVENRFYDLAHSRKQEELRSIPYLDYRVDQGKVKIIAGLYSFNAEIGEYPPGSVLLEDAPNASALIEALVGEVERTAALSEVELRTKVKIFGAADGIPVREGAVYKGEYGRVDRYYHTQDGSLQRLYLEPGETELTNEIIAALRGHGVERELSKCDIIRKAETALGVSVVEEVGGRYRRAIVEVEMDGILAPPPEAIDLVLP